MFSFIKSFKPITPSSRHKVSLSYEDSIKNTKPLKSLLVRKKMTGGRSNTGHITTRHKGARFQRSKIRIISYKRENLDTIGIV